MGHCLSFLDGARACAEIATVLRPVILLCKGILRDQRTRRTLMLWLVGIAVVMMFFGSWLLPDAWGRAHPAIYFLYWAACGWLTLTGLLLAVFDILIVRATARAMRRHLEQQFAEKQMKGDDR